MKSENSAHPPCQSNPASPVLGSGTNVKAIAPSPARSASGARPTGLTTPSRPDSTSPSNT